MQGNFDHLQKNCWALLEISAQDAQVWYKLHLFKIGINYN